MLFALFLDAAVIVAALGWAGGLLALTAVVAPALFRSGTPEAATLMTTIFLRFDRLAVGAAAVVLLAEATGLIARRPMRGAARATRLALALALAACAFVQAGYLSPALSGLYHRGVHRGVGPLGSQFDLLHRASGYVARATVLFAVALAAAVLRGGRAPDAPRRPDDAV